MLKEIFDMIMGLSEGIKTALSVVIIILIALIIVAVVKCIKNHSGSIDSHSGRAKGYHPNPDELSDFGAFPEESDADISNGDYEPPSTLRDGKKHNWHITAYSTSGAVIGGGVYDVSKHPVTIGRYRPSDLGVSADRHLCVKDSTNTMGRLHCTLIRRGRNYYLKAKGSSHYINISGKKVRRLSLKKGQTVHMGRVKVVFELI